MSTEENKAIVRRMTEEFYNQGNVELAEDFFADTYVHHDSASPHVRDRDGLKQVLRAFLDGCPDLHITIDQLLAEGDTVTKRWTYHATHTGDLSGLPPTGKRITMSGLELFRLEGGKIVECWLGYDNLSLMQQLGVIPTAEQSQQAGA
ncbi:MAG TPA: ester cyclase [Roseiflexaceae bacterium]